MTLHLVRLRPDPNAPTLETVVEEPAQVLAAAYGLALRAGLETLLDPDDPFFDPEAASLSPAEQVLWWIDSGPQMSARALSLTRYDGEAWVYGEHEGLLGVSPVAVEDYAAA